MTLVDSHCHLDFKVFDNDRDTVVSDAVENGIKHIIVPSVSRSNWRSVSHIQTQYPITKVAYGLHPMFMQHHQASDIAALRVYLEATLKTTLENGHYVEEHIERPVAVGECGLDFFIKNSASQQHKEVQIHFFTEQLKLADEFSLPVIIHARKSLDLVLKYIRKHPSLRGVIHSFSGSRQQAEICIEHGFLLGFGGPITYTRASKLRKLVAELPLECLLLETDAPDQPDSSHYGQRNEPAFINEMVKTVAELRSTSIAKVAKVTTQNAKTLFKLS